MERFLEYEVQTGLGDEIEVTVSSFRKDKAIAILVEPKDLPVWRDYKNLNKPMRGKVELTPQQPVARLKVPEAGLWYVLLQIWDTDSAIVVRTPQS